MLPVIAYRSWKKQRSPAVFLEDMFHNRVDLKIVARKSLIPTAEFGENCFEQVLDNDLRIKKWDNNAKGNVDIIAKNKRGNQFLQTSVKTTICKNEKEKVLKITLKYSFIFLPLVSGRFVTETKIKV